MVPVRAALLLVSSVLVAAAACNRGRELASSDPEQRVAAVRAAAGQGASGTAVLLVAQQDPDPLVRRATAEAFASREGSPSVEALSGLLGDPDPEVVGLAARGLAARPTLPQARDALVAAYGRATPAGRAAIADALQSVGTSLREAVELEARALWERNVAALAGRGPARAGAAEELGASARTEAVERLSSLVDPAHDPDRELVAAAARGLGEAGDWSARRHLEDLLEQGDMELAEAAADALGRLGDPGAADALATAAVQGAGRVPGAAVEALVALPQAPEVGASLCEVALRALDPAVAARAARAAREREAECPVKLLVPRLARPGAAAALAAMAELHPPDGDVVPRVIALLDPGKDPDADLRVAALQALGRSRSPQAAAAVRDRTQALAARVTAARTRWVPGQLGSSPLAGIDAVGESRVSAVVARAPGPGVGAEAGEPALPPYFPPPAGDLVELGAALAAAGRAHAGGTEALLAALAADPDAGVRAGAVEGLGALGGDRALALLGAALSDPADPVRAAAAAALPRFGPRGATLLAKALAAPGLAPDSCVPLARALGEAGSAEAVPALAQRLSGPCGGAAAQALARIGAPASAGPLTAALDQPEGPGMVEVIEALAQLGSGAGAAALTRALTSDRPQVRAAAARALAAMRYEPAGDRLEALRSDYYGRVRRAAVEALAKLPSAAAGERP